MAGLLGPKMARVLTPMAPARCVMPLSLPKNRLEQPIIAVTCSRVNSETQADADFSFCSCSLLNLSISAGPRRKTVWLSFCENVWARAQKLSMCQHLCCPPLPGWIASVLRFGLSPAALSNSRPWLMSEPIGLMKVSDGSNFSFSKGRCCKYFKPL